MTKQVILAACCIFYTSALFSQTNPAIFTWLRNTTGIQGRHYVAGNSTPINDAYPANVQSVKYTPNWVYVSCSGIPSYIIGPYQDGNPSQGINNNNIYKIPLNPVKNNGNPTNTNGGTIGVFINGVSLFDYRDGVSYNINTGTNQGGPTGGMGNGVWNRDAIVAERVGFDCAKGHPAMGNYHHHQNPSAFNLDLSVISNVCNLYLADGLYVIDSTKHAPLLGFAYDGFPIYGAYGYKNTDGTGGITRMKSSYSLRSITIRTHYANGTDVTDGPNVGGNFPLGMYREDYQYNPTSATTPDFLDEHNGRFCVTPEYPNGIYCYFSTVNQNWNSAYPYVVGPTFYGVKNVTRVTSINETTTTYNGPPLAATTLLSHVGCSGEQTGAIQLVVTGGNPPYTFNWGNGITSQNRIGLSAGNYSVTISDISAQTTVQTAVITQPLLPLVSATTIVPIQCFGASTGEIHVITTGGTPPYSYSWNDGDTSSIRINLLAGTYTCTILDANNCLITVYGSIFQPNTALTVSAAVSPIACFGNTTGIIQLNPSGGTPGYSYEWSDGNNQQFRSGLAAGTYRATITDAKLCSKTVSEYILQPTAALSVSSTVTPVACYGATTGAIQLFPSGGTLNYDILWNDGNTSVFRTDLPAGTYSATITDAHYCIYTIADNIDQNSNITPTVNASSATCGESNGAIALSVEGGTPPYAYYWNNGAVTQQLENLSSGAYSVTIADNLGCSIQNTTAISSLNGPTAVALTSNIRCPGDSTGIIELTVSAGNPPFSFHWSDGNINQSRSNLPSGIYSVTILDANNCAAVIAENIDQPSQIELHSTFTPETCNQNNGAVVLQVEGGTMPYSFLWSNGQTNQNSSELTPGDYAVTMTDANGCQLNYTTTLVAVPGPMANASCNDIACFGDATGSIQLNVFSGTPPFNYLWNNGFVGPNQAGLLAGNYAVTITDAYNCPFILTKSINQPFSTLGLSIEAEHIQCFGDTTGSINLFAFGGTSPYSYTWNNGMVGQQLSSLSAGTYSLLVTDANGCAVSNTQTIEQPTSALSVSVVSTNATAWNNGTAAATANGGTAPYLYVWSTGQVGNELNDLPPGNYTVTVSDAQQCTVTFTVTIDQTISTDDIQSEINIKVFPNPAAELILVQSQRMLTNDYSVSLMNSIGQVLAQKNLPQGSTLCYFETETLYDGIYFLTITDGTTSKVVQVVVNRR